MLRRQALRELLDAIGGDPFDVQSMIAGDSDASAWIAGAATVPFLSESRTVIVRNLLRSGHPKEALEGLGDALSTLPEFSRLILIADDEAATDSDRIRRLESYRKAWEAEVKKAKGLVLDFAAEGKEIKKSIFRAAEERGKKIGDRAAELLIEMTGRSLSRALEELDKVVLYVGEAETIQEKDVAEAAMPSREWNVFKLVDSIVEGNVGQGIAQLRSLMESGAKAEAAAMANIFPTVSRNLRLIWQARVLLEHRASLNAIPENVRALLPEQGFLSASEWQQRRAMAAARKLDLHRIGACLEALARCDGRIKGLGASLSTAEALERMVLEMAEAVRSGAATAHR